MSAAVAQSDEGFFARLNNIRPEERKAVYWASAFFFCVLSSYNAVKPIRDTFGIEGGANAIPFLFTATLLVTIALNPVWSGLISKFPAHRCIAFAYRFFMVNLLVFYGLMTTMTDKAAQVWIGRVFFVWLSVFNLVVLSAMWAFFVDTFRSEQAKRLFGIIGVGGTAGALIGAVTASRVSALAGKDPVILMLVALVLLECGVQCMRQVSKLRSTVQSAPGAAGEVTSAASQSADTAVGGSAFAGVAALLKSPYLVGICIYLFLYTITSTVLYLAQLDIVGKAIADRAARTTFLANITTGIQGVTLVMQLFLTGRIVKRLGVGLTLAAVPAIGILGFITLGLYPTLIALVTFQVARGAAEYALTRPAREVLYTVVSREDRFKAKNFIDTAVYRTGDQVGAWSQTFLQKMGMAVSSVPLVAAPLAALGLVIGLWLGLRQGSMARHQETAVAAPPHKSARVAVG